MVGKIDIRAAHARGHDAADAARQVAAQLARPERPHPALVLFFASTTYDRPLLARSMKEAFPRSLVGGCTTMGEIGINGWTKGGISSLAIGGPGFRVAGAVIDELSTLPFARTAGIVHELCAALDTTPERAAVRDHFGITLTDGLSGMEEILMASLGLEAVGLPIVGGSAADDFALTHTTIFHEGRSYEDAALFLLCRCEAPFHTFKSNHYTATTDRVVVTSAQPDKRRISELDGFPAVAVYARILGVTEEELRRDPPAVISRAGRNFAFFVNGEAFMRSVISVDGDHLLMGGAIEEGVVLTVMRSGDLLDDTRRTMAKVQAALEDDVGGMLLFNCGGRYLEAELHGTVRQVSDAMIVAPAAGFHTYGEQFGFLQVNHTLTGIALARGEKAVGS
jgi:hypothetical protein